MMLIPKLAATGVTAANVRIASVIGAGSAKKTAAEDAGTRSITSKSFFGL